MTNDIPEITLNDGTIIPAIGFGTVGLKGSEGIESITNAVNNGYRLIDTAYNYENEGTVGAALKRTSVPREKLFIASKLPGRYHNYEKAVKTIQESLYRANLDYFDLYLIHWPNPSQGLYVEAWQALLDAKKWGLIRSVGVSNFLPEHMDRLKKETGVLPSINQVEMHPYFNQEQQRKWHAEHGVATESWSPLSKANDIMTEQTLKTIAAKHGKSVAQVILRWQHQHHSVPIPKSTSAKRQLENISIFDFTLDTDDMTAIDKLTQPDGRNNDLDPAVYEEF